MEVLLVVVLMSIPGGAGTEQSLHGTVGRHLCGANGDGEHRNDEGRGPRPPSELGVLAKLDALKGSCRTTLSMPLKQPSD